MASPTIFLSHSHQDADWRERIFVHLRAFDRQGQFIVWDDRRLGAGDDWSKEIAQALNAADVAVLLISANFLASHFIQSAEIPRLLERQANEGLAIVPVIVRPCPWEHVDWLARLQVLPPGGVPLVQWKNWDEALFEVGRRIIDVAEIVSAQKASAAPQPRRKRTQSDRGRTAPIVAQDSSRKHVFICHEGGDGDFAELLKLRLEKSGFEAWIDVDRLHVGVDWRAEIDEAIRNASALIVVVTPDSKQSEYVTYEWSFAAGSGVKVIPLMVRTTQLHPRLESLQYLDFTNRRARPWDRLIEELSMNANGSKSK